jgi:hypothetical protein
MQTVHAQNLKSTNRELHWTGCCKTRTFKNGGWTCSGCGSQVGRSCGPHMIKTACHTTNDESICIPTREEIQANLMAQ